MSIEAYKEAMKDESKRLLLEFLLNENNVFESVEFFQEVEFLDGSGGVATYKQTNHIRVNFLYSVKDVRKCQNEY